MEKMRAKSTFASYLSKTNDPNIVYSPSLKFYQEVAINRHRFAKLYRGEVTPTEDEIRQVTEFFHDRPSDYFLKTAEQMEMAA